MMSDAKQPGLIPYLDSEVSVRAIRVFRAAEENKPAPETAMDLVAARWGMAPDDAVNWATIPMLRRRAGYFGEVLAEYVDPRVRRKRVRHGRHVFFVRSHRLSIAQNGRS
jgi:hypothetical protein